MHRRLAIVVPAMLLPTLLEAGPAVPETTFRIDIVEPEATLSARRILSSGGGILSWDVPLPGPDSVVPVVGEIVLETRVEPCFSDPDACDGGENFKIGDGEDAVYGCSDREDNDGDGATDADDPDCRGVQGWSLVWRADACFTPQGATVAGTAGDVISNPPGLRDELGGSFEKTEIATQWETCVVSAVVLSFTNPIIPPQIGEVPILRFRGEYAPGDGSACRLAWLPHSGSCFSSGEPVFNAATVGGATDLPQLWSAELRPVVPNLRSSFRRGDANDDTVVDMSDPIRVLTHLFLGGEPTNCPSAFDGDDSGEVNLADAIFLLGFLFLQGALPPDPGPRECGRDPTPDTLVCLGTRCDA